MSYLKIYQWERSAHPWAFEPEKHSGILVLLQLLNPLAAHFKVRLPGVGFADLDRRTDAEYVSEAVACVHQLLKVARAIRSCGGCDTRYAERLEERAASFRNGQRLNGNDVIVFNTDAPPSIGLLLHEFAHHVCWHQHGHWGHRSPFPRILREVYAAYIRTWEPNRALPTDLPPPAGR